MIGVVFVMGPIPRPPPGDLHGRPGGEPGVVHVVTEAMREIVRAVQIAQPGLLADGEMNQANVGQGAGATIFTILLARQAFAHGILVFIAVIATG